jgi:dienelactone hydrolase
VTGTKQSAINGGKRSRRGLFIVEIVLCCSLFGPAHAQLRIGAQEPEQGALRRQVWLVPSQDLAVPMRTLVYRPSGSGPFPLVIINHGSTQSGQKRAGMAQPEFLAAADFFVKRGYAVAVPVRPGHGVTGGPYLEGNSADGGCASADYRRSGLVTADSITAALDYLTKQSFVKRDGVIVVGQSAGGWGALALASRNPKAVKAIVNFAGGRGGRVHDRPNNNCAPERLVEAAAVFGKTARIPVLSIYTENDSYFGPSLSKKINEAYAQAGGRDEYKLLPAFGRDGHMLLPSRDGVAVWGPVVDEFLNGVK